MWRPSVLKFQPYFSPYSPETHDLHSGSLNSIKSPYLASHRSKGHRTPGNAPAFRRLKDCHSLLIACERIHFLLHTLMQPASETKHIPQLKYEFHGRTFLLNQRDDHGLTNGTTLWLGGQVLSYYLAFVLDTKRGDRKTAIELGSGIGLTALALHSLGWNVCATDVEPVLSTVLKPNLSANSQKNSTHISSLPEKSVPRTLECRELDWTVPIASWKWDQPNSIARHSEDTSTGEDQAVNERSNSSNTTLKPPYDLIITADTLYTPALIAPLLRSLHHLSRLSALPDAKFSCPVYLAVERRDPQLMDRAFEECSNIWGFKVERIRAAKIKKALERANVGWVEERSLWEGVEIWKLRLPAGAAPDPAVLTNPGG